MTHVTQQISDDMLGRHLPPDGADESFQESWGFAWHDPERQAGGIHHISYQRNRGIADILSWIAYDGRIVGKARHFNVLSVDRDFPDWEAAGVAVRDVTARSFGVHARTHVGGADVDLRFSGFTDPLMYDLDAEGATWGAHHYEVLGQVEGQVRLEGEPLPVSGFGWQDHSWGPRDMGHLLSHRWLLGIFGPDLFMSVMSIVTNRGPEPVLMGFVYDNGVIQAPTTLTFGARISDDGCSPEACDVRLTTDASRDYRIVGDVQVTMPQAQRGGGGFWCVDGLSTFDCDGRTGGGIFEISELRGPAPWHYADLGLTENGEVPAIPVREGSGASSGQAPYRA